MTEQLHSIISRLIFATAMVVYVSSAASAELQPDYPREGRLADEAIAGLFDGEVVYLNDGERDFLTLYSERDRSVLDGAVMVLHGRGFHPDWPQVAGPLREGLGDMDITTLSVQMPVLAKDAKYYEYLEILDLSYPRIEAAINFLKSKDYKWVAVVAHSCSVHMTMGWIRQVGDASIDAYVGIGMGATDYGQPMLEEFPLAQMTVPVLDVFGNADYPAVLKGAAARLSAMRSAGHPKSQQVILDGPDHFFEEYEDELTETVADWILIARGSL